MQKVLLFQVQKEKERQIKALCKELKIEAVTIEPRQFLEPLGVLAGISGIPEKKQIFQGILPQKEMLVLAGMEESVLDSFLQTYKEKGIAPIPLKAVLTPINLFWNPIELYEELAKEHEAMTKK